MSAQDGTYTLLAVKLPDDDHDADVAERLDGYEVKAKFRRRLTGEQVDDVIRKMDRAGMDVPSVTSGQDALQLSTREGHDVAPDG